MLTRLAGLVALGVVGCGDPARSVPVTVHEHGAVWAALLDDVGWQEVRAIGGADELWVADGTLALAYDCGHGDVVVRLRLPDEPLRADCTPSGAHELRIDSPVFAEAYVGRQAWSVPPAHDFEVDPGRHDVVVMASDGTARFGVWRDVEVPPSTTVLVELPFDAPTLIQREVGVVNLAGLPLGYVSAELVTANGTVVTTTTTGSALTAFPAGALALGDRQTATAVLYDAFDRYVIERGATVDVTGSDDPIAVVPYLGPIGAAPGQLDGLPGVAWSADGDWPIRRLELWTWPRWVLEPSEAWTAARAERDRIRFPDLTTMPDWDPAWPTSIDDHTGLRLRLERPTPDGSEHVSWERWPPAPED